MSNPLPTAIELAIPAASAAWLAFASRRARAGWTRWLGAQQYLHDTRFTIVEPPRKRAVLGRVIPATTDGTSETASDDDTQRPRHRFVIDAVALRLETQSGLRIRVRDGTRLYIREFNAAVVRPAGPDESDIAADGTRLLDVSADQPFYVLWDGSLEDASDGGPRWLPVGDRPYEVTTDPPPTMSDVAFHTRRLRWPYGAYVVAAAAGIAPALTTSIPAAAAWAVWCAGMMLAGARTLLRTTSWARTPDLPMGVSERKSAEIKATDHVGKNASFARPLWLQRMNKPEGWLLPTAGEERGVVHFVDLSDAHSRSGIDVRDAHVGAAAEWLRNAVAIACDAETRMMVRVVFGRARIHWTGGPMPESIVRDYVRHLPGRHLVVRGVVGERLFEDNVTLMIRDGASSDEIELRARLTELPHRMIEFLVERNLATRRASDRLVPVSRSAIADELCVIDRLIQQTLAGKLQAVGACNEAYHRKAEEMARALALAEPASNIALLEWAVAAVYAHEAGALDVAAGEKFVNALEARSRVDGMIEKLAVVVLHRLGRRDEAAKRQRDLLADAGTGLRGERPPDVQWLARALED